MQTEFAVTTTNFLIVRAFSIIRIYYRHGCFCTNKFAHRVTIQYKQILEKTLAKHSKTGSFFLPTLSFELVVENSDEGCVGERFATSVLLLASILMVASLSLVESLVVDALEIRPVVSITFSLVASVIVETLVDVSIVVEGLFDGLMVTTSVVSILLVIALVFVKLVVVSSVITSSVVASSPFAKLVPVIPAVLILFVVSLFVKLVVASSL